jgi:RNA polymerase sigma-70 factor (ECF subfamily)
MNVKSKTMTERTDHMLLFMADTLSESEKQKLEIMYDRYRRKMYTAAKRILNDGFKAEDAVQNAFVSIAKNINRININDEDALEGYVITIAKNEAYNVIRAGDKAELYDEEPVLSDPFFDVNAKVFEKEVYEKIISVLRSMDDIYRAPIYLNCVMGFSVKETAKQLHRNEQTVKGQITRGKKMIINKLKEAGYEF